MTPLLRVIDTTEESENILGGGTRSLTWLPKGATRPTRDPRLLNEFNSLFLASRKFNCSSADIADLSSFSENIKHGVRNYFVINTNVLPLTTLSWPACLLKHASVFDPRLMKGAGGVLD